MRIKTVGMVRAAEYRKVETVREVNANTPQQTAEMHQHTASQQHRHQSVNHQTPYSTRGPANKIESRETNMKLQLCCATRLLAMQLPATHSINILQNELGDCMLEDKVCEAWRPE